MGDSVQSTGPPSISGALARRTLGTCLGCAVATTVVFALASERLLHGQARRGVVSQAQACAAALTPGPNGDLSRAIEELRSRYDRLAAVAALDVGGNVRALYPPQESYATATAQAVRAEGKPVPVSVLSAGRLRKAWTVMVPINGHQTSVSEKIALLLWAEPYTDRWLMATALFAGTAITAALLASAGLIRWFECRFAEPLRSLTGRAPLRASPSNLAFAEHFNSWRELATVANRFRELNHHSRRIERETREQVIEHRRGLDLRLRRAEDRATRDPLTGLLNRAFLDAEIEPLFRNQHQAGHDFSIVMMDLDNFKVHNDTHGHRAGDELLRFIGELLGAAVRPIDRVVRFGGDEFCLLLPGAGAAQAAEVGERIVRLFAQYASSLGGQPRMSMSAGIASLVDNRPETGADLLAMADAALYSAKGKGKNAVATSGAC